MGTFIELKVYDENFDKNVFTDCINRVKEIEKWGNHFDPGSEISFVNRNSSKEWVEVNPDFYYILVECIKASKETNGAFDITVKPLIDFYKVKEKKSVKEHMIDAVPENILESVGYNNIVLNDKQQVFLKNNAQLDLSGVLKGFAVDEVVKIMKLNNVKKALINAGGNLYCLGTDENDKKWVIGIRDAENKAGIIKKLKITNKAVATSAGYERFIEFKKEKFSHIIDPRNGKMVKAEGSVTVVSDKALYADIYSTALYVDISLNTKIKEAEVYMF